MKVNQLVTDNYDLVPTMAHVLANRHNVYFLKQDIESALAEALLESAHKYNDEDESYDSFRAYAASIMRYRAVDEIRNYLGRCYPKAIPTKNEVEEWELEEKSALEKSPEDFYNMVHLQEQVINLVEEKFSTKECDAMLHLLRGESLQDVADRYGVSESRMCQVKTKACERAKRIGLLDELLLAA